MSFQGFSKKSSFLASWTTRSPRLGQKVYANSTPLKYKKEGKEAGKKEGRSKERGQEEGRTVTIGPLKNSFFFFSVAAEDREQFELCL